MDDSVRAAGGLLLWMGCTDAKIERSGDAVRIRTVFRGSPVIARVAVLGPWGTPSDCGSLRWDDDAFPLGFVPVPAKAVEGDGATAQTHHLILGRTLDRAVVVPNRLAVCSPRGTFAMLDGEWRRVPKGEEKVVFFRRRDGWGRDQHNVWKPPPTVPMDQDEYMDSLG